MDNSTWRVVATGAAAVTIASGAFALGAAMTSDRSGGGPVAEPAGSTSVGPSTVPGSAGPGSAAESATTTAAGSAQAVAIVDFAFGPAELSVTAGSTITWTNDDDVAHSVVSADAVLASPEMDQGATYEMTLDEAGTVDYYCDIHQYMKGTITVTP